jgi:hypothetical protein
MHEDFKLGHYPSVRVLGHGSVANYVPKDTTHSRIR